MQAIVIIAAIVLGIGCRFIIYKNTSKKSEQQ